MSNPQNPQPRYYLGVPLEELPFPIGLPDPEEEDLSDTQEEDLPYTDEDRRQSMLGLGLDGACPDSEFSTWGLDSEDALDTGLIEPDELGGSGSLPPSPEELAELEFIWNQTWTLDESGNFVLD